MARAFWRSRPHDDEPAGARLLDVESTPDIFLEGCDEGPYS
jgi:hypothetical protein